MKSIIFRYLVTVGLFMVLMVTASCDTMERYTGVYEARCPESADTIIELSEHGEGVLKRAGEEIPFSWETKGRELRIYTREGGIMIGKLKLKTLSLTLPAEETLIFTKTE